jgi:hypothetical protein
MKDSLMLLIGVIVYIVVITLIAASFIIWK